MKSTGVVRKVDDLGRVVIPKELRGSLDIKPQDAMEIFVHENTIILSKYEPGCIFCPELTDLIEFQGRMICRGCLDKMNQAK